jgi:hypothetical protein
MGTQDPPRKFVLLDGTKIGRAGAESRHDLRAREGFGLLAFPWYGVEQRGIEHAPPSAPRAVDRRVDDADQATKDDERRREVSASGDVVEGALAKAIEAEVQERRPGWESRVAVLAGELQARRLARERVTSLDATRRQRGP